MTDGSRLPETLCQQALERVLTYLHDDGAVVTADICRQALRLVDEALADGAGPDLPGRCIALIPVHFESHCQQAALKSFPPPRPPLKRGHIGYYPHA